MTRSARETPARRRRIGVVVLAILGVWFVLTLIAFGLFSAGGSDPGDGRGKQVTVGRSMR